MFRASDESALSIVPSRLSSRLDTSSIQSRESTELTYRRLSFEDLLFTARVYKRNSRHRGMNNTYESSQSWGKEASRQIEEISEQNSDATHSVYDASSILRQYQYSLSLHDRRNENRKMAAIQKSHDHWHLDLAVSQGRLDILGDILLQSTDDLKEWKKQALLKACRSGDVPLIKILAERGAGFYEDQSLASTAKSKATIIRGADGWKIGTWKSEFTSQSPIHEAVRNNQLGAVRTLVDHGADIEDNSVSWGTPIHGCGVWIR